LALRALVLRQLQPPSPFLKVDGPDASLVEVLRGPCAEKDNEEKTMWRRRERESRFEEHHVGRAIALIAAGIGIGSGIALLVAPNSGEEVRHALGRRYLKTMKRLGRSTEGLRDRLEEMLALANDLRAARGRRFLRRRAIEERLRAA
jgi:hypothetical protein